MKFRSIVMPALLALPLAACVTGPKVDRLKSQPMVIAMDVDPGYARSVLIPADGEGEIHLAARIIEPNPSKKWDCTIFICLVPDGDTKNSYCVNLTNDRTLNRNYGHARLYTEGSVHLSKKSSSHYALDRSIEMRLVRNGHKVSAYVDGELLDEGEVGFEPSAFKVGGSSGEVLIQFLESPPPPAPE